MKKVHLHDEQFDGWLHAACARLDAQPPSDVIVDEDSFEEVPRDRRCRFCSGINWPKGGEPS